MAHIAEWRVRETTTTEGTSDLVLAGAMRGSLPFSSVMATNDTCDYVVHYDTVFEAGLGTMGADGKLQRTTVYRARHANGDINTTKVSLPPGVKTIIMAARAAKMVRVDRVQSFTSGETAQARANTPPFESGTRMLFQQTTAPVGWTKDTSSHNDKALRVVTGTVSSGGSVAFSTVFGRTSTDTYALTQANLPSITLTTTISAGQGSHLHTGGSNWSGVLTGGSDIPFGSGYAVGAQTITTNNSTLPAMSGTTPLGGSNTAHSHALDMRVQYADVIIAVAG